MITLCERGRFQKHLLQRAMETRASAALEFAVVAIPFTALLLFVAEVSMDLFFQSALDSALQVASRQIQTGNAQNAKSGADFITNYLCPDLGGLLDCTALYIKVQHIAPSSSQDFYAFTTGQAPVTAGNNLDLSSFSSASFCNGGPSELLLVSVIYVGPTIVGAIYPNSLGVYYNGQTVHATLSTIGIVSEGYPATAAPTGTAPAC